MAYNHKCFHIAEIIPFIPCFTVQMEIDERRQFQRDMEAVGQGEKYRSLIETQISQVNLQLLAFYFDHCFPAE